MQGGDSDKLGSVNYHPFYITSSRDGGYGKKTESEKRTEAIWAGVEEAIRLVPTVFPPSLVMNSCTLVFPPSTLKFWFIHIF